MYPAPFEYYTPETVDDAVALLERHGEDAKLLAGGHSLLPLLKLRVARPAQLIDLRRIAFLSGIRREGEDLVIGAMTTHSSLAASRQVQMAIPIVAEAASQIGDQQVRNRGTIGGSLAHADPGADLPAVVLATDARMVAVGPRGSRTIPADRFFVGLLATALAPGEVLVEVRIAMPAARTGGAYSKHPHPASRYAIVGVAATITLDRAGKTIAQARVALTGLGEHAVRALGAEKILTGGSPDVETLHAAAGAIADAVEPNADLQGGPEYKVNLARVHAERALTLAAARAQE
jgi:aerobic carbon-monoxide dehydrogenase medium subunit